VHKLASEEQSPACLLVFCPQLALDAILPFRMISNTESRTAERQNGRTAERQNGRTAERQDEKVAGQEAPCEVSSALSVKEKQH